MDFSCCFYNIALLLGDKHFIHTLNHYSSCKKRAIRATSHQSFLAHTLPIFKDLKLLRIADIFKLRLLPFVYEAINRLAPNCFHDFFSLNFSIHCHKTRQSTRGDLLQGKIST